MSELVQSLVAPHGAANSSLFSPLPANRPIIWRAGTPLGGFMGGAILGILADYYEGLGGGS